MKDLSNAGKIKNVLMSVSRKKRDEYKIKQGNLRTRNKLTGRDELFRELCIENEIHRR